MDRLVSLPAVPSAQAAQPAGRAVGVGAGSRFSEVLKSEQNGQASAPLLTAPPTSRVVRHGDTLTGLVKTHYREQGLRISEAQAYRQALQLAQHNGLDNPDLITPDQVIQMDALTASASVRGPALAQTAPQPATQAAAVQTSATSPDKHSLLDKTLARAVAKGYVKPEQTSAVTQKVLALSGKYRFQPDDFARLTLMESGGMNPSASNGHCHGIIQFCGGANRGAAAVGLRDNPRAILGMGLLQQLDLVDTYFEHVGLAQGQQPTSLDELYLSVLTPAARAERGRDVPLAIPGPQAKDLHVGGNRKAPITRNSITQGLHALAERIFGHSSANQRRLGLYAALSNQDGGS